MFEIKPSTPTPIPQPAQSQDQGTPSLSSPEQGLTPPPKVDLAELTERVLKIRRGELPPDAVTDAELRAGIALQRSRYAEGAREEKKTRTTKPKKQGAIDFDFDTPVGGGLF